MEFLFFILVLVGNLLLCAHLFFAAAILSHETLVRGRQILCFVILYPFFLVFALEWGLYNIRPITILTQGYRGNQFLTFLTILALIGVASLPFSIVGIVVPKISATKAGKALFILMIAVLFFLLWRWYAIIMIRENFWVMIAPLVFTGAAIWRLLEGSQSIIADTILDQDPTAWQGGSVPPPSRKITLQNPRDAFSRPPKRLGE